MTNAYELARSNGVGALLGHTNGYVYEVSDYSPSQRAAYGWPIDGTGRGGYQRIPDGQVTKIANRNA